MCPLARGTHVTGRAGRRLLSGRPAPAGPGSAVAKAEDGPGVAGGAAGSAGRAVWGAPRPLCPAGRETASPRCAAGPPRRDSCTRGSVSASARQYVPSPRTVGVPSPGPGPFAKTPGRGSRCGLVVRARAPAPGAGPLCAAGPSGFRGHPGPLAGQRSHTHARPSEAREARRSCPRDPFPATLLLIAGHDPAGAPARPCHRPLGPRRLPPWA